MKKFFGVNWMPRIIGAATAFFGFVTFEPSYFSGQPWLVSVAKFALAGGLAGLGFVTKQHNVTGGTIQQKGVREEVEQGMVAKNVDVVPAPEKK